MKAVITIDFSKNPEEIDLQENGASKYAILNAVQALSKLLAQQYIEEAKEEMKMAGIPYSDKNLGKYLDEMIKTHIKMRGQ